MAGEPTLEQRLYNLESQLRIMKSIAVVTTVVLVGWAGSEWVGASSPAQLQDVQLRRIDAQILYVRSIVLQDGQGQTRGLIEGGILGEPRIELLGVDKQQRVSLSAGSDSGALYLSGGKPGPSILLNASAGQLSPTGLNIQDREGVFRVSAGITPSDFGSIANIELKARNNKPAVYMAATRADGSLQVSATSGSIRLDSERVSSGQSEPVLSIWQSVAGTNSERIRVGIVDGQPRLETLPGKSKP